MTGGDESKEYLQEELLQCMAFDMKLLELVDLPNGLLQQEWIASHSEYHTGCSHRRSMRTKSLPQNLMKFQTAAKRSTLEMLLPEDVAAPLVKKFPNVFFQAAAPGRRTSEPCPLW